MKYQCQSCGQKSNQVNSQGGCIACDSFNMKRINSTSSTQSAEEKESKTKLEITIMLALWSLLLYGVWDKYLSQWFA